MLKLMYITNDPKVAVLAESAGVDRVWVDLEYIGKAERQGGMDTVQNHHTVEDVRRVRAALSRSDLLVRVNPIHDGSREEIDGVIAAGADLVMLPFFHTADEVRAFLNLVGGRARTMLLFETPGSVEQIDRILALPGIGECHIGLNDLHLGYGQKFLFEPLADGTVDRMCRKFREAGKPYGFGGIARIGTGKLPADLILSEHVRLGSSLVILSRSFCDFSLIRDYDTFREIMDENVVRLRKAEAELSLRSAAELETLHRDASRLIGRIAEGSL